MYKIMIMIIFRRGKPHLYNTFTHEITFSTKLLVFRSYGNFLGTVARTSDY